jgi:hypothetical protein
MTKLSEALSITTIPFPSIMYSLQTNAWWKFTDSAKEPHTAIITAVVYTTCMRTQSE